MKFGALQKRDEDFYNKLKAAREAAIRAASQTAKAVLSVADEACGSIVGKYDKHSDGDSVSFISSITADSLCKKIPDYKELKSHKRDPFSFIDFFIIPTVIKKTPKSSFCSKRQDSQDDWVGKVIEFSDKTKRRFIC